MIKIENECLIFDNGVVKPFKSIHMVKPFGDNLYFVNINNGHCEQYPYNVNMFYEVLIRAKQSNFILVRDTILNCCLIDHMYIQMAKDTLTEEFGFNLHTVFNNGRVEKFFFETHNEAEHYYHKLENKISDIKSAEAISRLSLN